MLEGVLQFCIANIAVIFFVGEYLSYWTTKVRFKYKD